VDKKTLMKYIASFVMGDGGVYRITNGNSYKFVGGHAEKHRDYVDWKCEILKELTTVRVSRVLKERRQPYLRIETNTHPIYRKVRNRLYVNGNRRIDPHYLTLMDWEMMAILFQDDGNAKDRSLENRKPSITLPVCMLSFGDSKLFADAVSDKLGIFFNVVRAGKGYYNLRLRNKDGAVFMQNIKPYLQKSFEYKWISPNAWLCDKNTDGDTIRT